MQNNQQTVTLPANKRAVIYTRVVQIMSRSGRELVNVLIARNADILLMVAHQHGFTENSIVMYEDKGKE